MSTILSVAQFSARSLQTSGPLPLPPQQAAIWRKQQHPQVRQLTPRVCQLCLAFQIPRHPPFALRPSCLLLETWELQRRHLPTHQLLLQLQSPSLWLHA